MKRFPQAILFTAAMMFAVSALAQEPQDVQNPPPERQVDRMKIVRDLGLSQDQIRQMRLLNQDVRSKRQAARRRVNEAGRNLDQAIYADTVDEALVATRLRDLQDAQAEIVRINFENEFAIRKILTPEQLVRFRDIRQKFNEARDNIQRRRQNRRQNRNKQRPGAEQPPPAKDTKQLRPKG